MEWEELEEKKSEIPKTNGYFFDRSRNPPTVRSSPSLSSLLHEHRRRGQGPKGGVNEPGVQPARRGERMWDQGAARRPARQRKSSVPSLSTPPSATPPRRMHGTRRRRPSWTACQAVARLDSPGSRGSWGCKTGFLHFTFSPVCNAPPAAAYVTSLSECIRHIIRVETFS